MPRSRLPLFAILTLVAIVPAARAQNNPAPSSGSADRLVGVWKTEPDGGDFAHVEVTRNGDIYSGKIVWLNHPDFPASEGPRWAGRAKVDRKNPDPSLRGRPIVGLEILRGFKYDGKDVWGGGTIYDPKKGKTYRCKITLEPDGTLFVRGFIGFSWLGRTTVWTPAHAPGPNGDSKANGER
ncbi:MAG TPA: DUF2147 domain-containing protein [Thermoanaerobaculia bacterium]|nr:DUF2147 domain-containing protein [Thermoanaerobaculia bacterium]